MKHETGLRFVDGELRDVYRLIPGDNEAKLVIDDARLLNSDTKLVVEGQTITQLDNSINHIKDYMERFVREVVVSQ